MGALWGVGVAKKRCKESVPAGLGALALLVTARSRFPAAGCWLGFGESPAVLFSDTRGEPCLGFAGADGRAGPCRAPEPGAAPPLLRSSQEPSGLVAFTLPLAVFPCAAAWVTHHGQCAHQAREQLIPARLHPWWQHHWNKLWNAG